MSSYQVGVTPFAMPHWDVGHLSARPYLLCLDCGELWVQVAGRVHEIKKEHDGRDVCPAAKASYEAHEAQLAFEKKARASAPTYGVYRDGQWHAVQ